MSGLDKDIDMDMHQQSSPEQRIMEHVSRVASEVVTNVQESMKTFFPRHNVSRLASFLYIWLISLKEYRHRRPTWGPGYEAPKLCTAKWYERSTTK